MKLEKGFPALCWPQEVSDLLRSGAVWQSPPRPQIPKEKFAVPRAEMQHTKCWEAFKMTKNKHVRKPEDCQK